MGKSISHVGLGRLMIKLHPEVEALPHSPNKISLLHMYMYINIASDC
jgi:hypothetical protein